VLILNVVLLTCSTLFAVFYPNIGTVLRFVGAICGFLYLFLIPVAIHIFALRKEGSVKRLTIFLHSLIVALGVALMISQFIP